MRRARATTAGTSRTLAAACGRRPTPVALQCKVLATMGRGNPELALSFPQVAVRAARIVAELTGAGSSAG